MMNKWLKFKQFPIIYPIAVMFAICLVITAALAGTNALTSGRIEKLNEQKETQAKSRLIKAEVYETKTVEYEKTVYEYSVAKNNGEAEGYIFKINEKGYGGTISVMIAVNIDGSVKAIELLDVSNETPGLGQNTAGYEFREQFEGKDKILTAAKYGTAMGDHEINAVASATISSRAVTAAVNKAFVLTNIINEKNITSVTDTSTEGE